MAQARRNHDPSTSLLHLVRISGRRPHSILILSSACESSCNNIGTTDAVPTSLSTVKCPSTRQTQIHPLPATGSPNPEQHGSLFHCEGRRGGRAPCVWGQLKQPSYRCVTTIRPMSLPSTRRPSPPLNFLEQSAPTTRGLAIQAVVDDDHLLMH